MNVNLYADFPDNFDWEEQPLFTHVDSLVVPLFCESFSRRGASNATVRFADIDTAKRAELIMGGEVFVLDMSEPVSIYELAVALIRDAGLEPEKDIKIAEIGLRVGEKLTEELSTSTQALSPTKHARIFVEHSPALPKIVVEEELKALAIGLASEKSMDIVKEALQIAVPTYTPKK